MVVKKTSNNFERFTALNPAAKPIGPIPAKVKSFRNSLLFFPN